MNFEQLNLDFPPVRVAFDVRLRVCGKEDLRELEWEGMFRGSRRIIQGAYKRQLRGDNLMLLADANERPIGQLWLDLALYRKERRAYLWAMRVVPWFRGLGVGAWLLQCAQEVVTGLGYEAMTLLVAKSNSGARRLYKRAGFAEMGQIEMDETRTTRTRKRVHLRPLHVHMLKMFNDRAIASPESRVMNQPCPHTAPLLQRGSGRASSRKCF